MDLEMSNSILPLEKKALFNYRFVDKIRKGQQMIRAIDLIDPEKAQIILEKAGKKMGVPNRKVTASLLVKRMAFYAVIHLFSMSMWNKKIQVDVQDVLLLVEEKDTLWLADFYFGHYSLDECQENREKWRETVVLEIFAGFFQPVIETLFLMTGFSMKAMWENVTIYIHWLYENLLEECPEDLKERIQEDYHFLLHEAQGSLFGTPMGNPLSAFDSKKEFRKEHDQWIRIRKTCCLSILLPEKKGKRCTTCPL
jgi:ferric iron reductase protein FhuF